MRHCGRPGGPLLGLFVLGALLLLGACSSQATVTGIPTVTPASVRPGSPTATSTATRRFPLTITEPADESVVDTDRITIRGRTIPGAVVSINREEVDVDPSGAFAMQVDLDEGPNLFFIVASDADGNVEETDLLVSWVP